MNLTVNEAAKDLGISAKTIRRRIDSGEIPVLRIAANCIRIELSDFEAYKVGLKARKPYTRKKA